MDYMIYLYYPLLMVLLFYGGKLYRKNTWNDDFMSLSQTKALQGFFAVCVVLHHIAQKTCANWLDAEYIVHGLDVFVPIGYLFVGIFLFCSGYGLYKSYQEKPDYLQGFFGRRILPLILTFITTDFIFLVARIRMGSPVGITQPFRVSGPDLANQYAWFVFALLILYIGFYLAFRFCKKEKTAIFVAALVTFAYMLHCDYWIYGTWWYNAVTLFVIGILFAKYEKAVVEKIKKQYWVYVGLSFVSTLVCFFLSENIQPLFSLLGEDYSYGISRWTGVILQNLAAIAYVSLVFMLGMKVRIGNKVLGFLGAVTLELYLIHGLFVQLFGYSFIYDDLASLYYIRNVALLVLVVLVLSVPIAFGLHVAIKWTADFLIRKKDSVKSMWDYLKKPAIGLLALLLVITVFSGISSHQKSKNVAETVKAYGDENITYVDIDGEKMATTTLGEGEHTLVLLAGYHDPCPSITLKPLAERLAEKNRVIILEYFGHGFSEDTDKERTCENFVYEIHTALEQLGEKGPYILMPHTTSGLYAQLYTYTYPEEVEAVIGLESYVAEQVRDTLNVQRMVPGEYEKILKRSGETQHFAQRVLELTGYVRTQWNGYRPVFKFNKKQELEVLEEMSVDQYCSMNAVSEAVYEYRNAQKVIGQKYAEDLPVLFLLGHYTSGGHVYEGLDWEQLHQDLLTNPEIQEIEILHGNQYFVYYTIDAIAKNAQEFIDKLDKIK